MFLLPIVETQIHQTPVVQQVDAQKVNLVTSTSVDNTHAQRIQLGADLNADRTYPRTLVARREDVWQVAPVLSIFKADTAVLQQLFVE
jgi:hypothetical protein